MLDNPVKLTNFKLLLSETVSMGEKSFEQAKLMSQHNRSEAEQWQKYLNYLALFGVEGWLTQRIPELPINRESINFLNVSYLKLGNFRVCVIATENVLDEVITIPQSSIKNPELAAHFYIAVEVLEEAEEIIIRGFLRYDELQNYCHQVNLLEYYQIPLEKFDLELNHLILYCHYVEPSAILPVIKSNFWEKTTKLSQWVQGVFDEGWLTLESFISPEANLALSTRNVTTGIKRGKLIDLGMQLGRNNLALLVNITEEAENKLGVLIQLHPTHGERYLPANLQLSLLSKSGKVLQEVESRAQDNYIQLKHFKGEVGVYFSISVKILNLSIVENFVL